ncbi:APC family permease [Pseudomonas sp. BGr12]|uniref:APC family permease n=1 Tax=Pseudomonas sp. BGr12 TaxID=2936269 RepID=UPI0025598D3C|nr:APC family permease [Pseudomonas sp. BJa5]MDL2428478.1 APC family permease [Pseudomonas sp. BJa5]
MLHFFYCCNRTKPATLVGSKMKKNEITDVPSGALKKNAIGLMSVVFLVIATNGPLTALLGGTPASFVFGNGIAIPGVYLVMGLIYILFSVGFSAMSAHVSNAGAFYAHINLGLGPSAGIGAASMAIAAYQSLQIALYALFGFFSADFLSRHAGIHVPWWVMCCVLAVIVHAFACRNIEFNGKILSILMLCEVGIIFLFDLAVLIKGGPDGFTTAPFEPKNIFSGGFGVALVFISSAYMGFETAAIYSEEAKNPKRTIPLAIVIAVTLIMLFYALSTWLLVVAYGEAELMEMAKNHPGEIWFVISERLLGNWAADLLGMFMITSLFAAILSFHNTISRYLFSLGRERVIHPWFSKVSMSQRTPYNASLFQAVVMIGLVLYFASRDLDPMTVIMPIAAAPATIGILAVQCLAAISVIGFFRVDKRDTTLWQRSIAPFTSFLILATCLYLVVVNMSLLTGVDSALNWILPMLIFVAGLAGAVYGQWMKFKEPERYRVLSSVLTRV